MKKIYPSKSSGAVKTITLCTILVSIFVLASFVLLRKDLGPVWSIVLSIIIISTVIYFYANSLRAIIVTDKSIVLQKRIGKIEIDISQIESVKRMQYAAISMTTGNIGLFGFIGRTMENSSTFVKNRRQMVQITTTSNKKYLVSCENSENLVNTFKVKSNSKNK